MLKLKNKTNMRRKLKWLVEKNINSLIIIKKKLLNYY